MKILADVRLWFFVNLLALWTLVGVNFATNVPASKWWPDTFAVATNLFAGGLVSFLFYFLVVYLPEDRKKAIIKANLLRMYRNIKEDILWAVIYASIKGGRKDFEPNGEMIKKLMSPAGFKDAFEHGREADEGFYAFENEMSSNTFEFRKIILNLHMLSKQIEFLLHNYSMQNQEAFDFFKRVELVLMQLQESGPGYDESKPLCRFIWEMYTGWNWVEGDTGEDRIQKMIGEL